MDSTSNSPVCPMLPSPAALYLVENWSVSMHANAEAVAGVQQVIGLSQKVVVIAENTWAAIKGRDALEISWDEGENADLNSAAIRDSLAEKAPQPGSASRRRDRGHL